MPTLQSRLIPKLNLNHSSFHGDQLEHLRWNEEEDKCISPPLRELMGNKPRYSSFPSSRIPRSSSCDVATMHAFGEWEYKEGKEYSSFPSRGQKTRNCTGDEARWPKKIISIAKKDGYGSYSYASSDFQSYQDFKRTIPLFRFGRDKTVLKFSESWKEKRELFKIGEQGTLEALNKPTFFSSPSLAAQVPGSKELPEQRSQKYVVSLPWRLKERVCPSEDLTNYQAPTGAHFRLTPFRKAFSSALFQTKDKKEEEECCREGSIDVSQSTPTKKILTKIEANQSNHSSRNFSAPSLSDDSDADSGASKKALSTTAIVSPKSPPLSFSYPAFFEKKTVSPSSVLSASRKEVKTYSETEDNDSVSQLPIEHRRGSLSRKTSPVKSSYEEVEDAQEKMHLLRSQQNQRALLEGLGHRITLDMEPVVPPKVLHRCHTRPPQWRRYPSHIIVLLLLQKKGLRPSRHPDIFNYHMAEVFLRYISICMEGAYFIYYETGCIPRERFFRIRLSPEDWNGNSDDSMPVLPYLVATIHRSGASVIKSVPLHHLVGVSCGPSGPSFAPFLVNQEIIQGCVERSRNRATFLTAGTFRLLFYDEKYRTSSTFDLLTSDHAVFDIWTKTFKGLTSVNSSSVVQIPLSEDGYNTEEQEAFCEITIKNAEESARLRRRGR